MRLHFLPLLVLPCTRFLVQDESFVSKRLVERPIELALDAAPPPSTSSNRAVAPGLVRWHPDFAAACAAAQRSGKPVLLFQLLGRLDQEFC